MSTTERPRDIATVTLSVLAIGLLITAAFWVLRPFIPATVWAAMIVITTWPTMLAIQRRLWGRRSLAVAVMTILLLLVVLGPLCVAVYTIITHSGDFAAAARALAAYRPGPVPPWLASLPVVGQRAAEIWNHLATSDADALAQQLLPYLDDVRKFFLGALGDTGALVVQLLLTAVISAIMYAGGDSAALAVRRFFLRLAGQRGENVVLLAARAVRGVALGVGVTAIVQSLLGGAGLAIAGVPFAGLLTAVMFVLCIAQVGPILVLAPAVVWLFWSGATGWGTFLLVWTLIVGSLDNILRPILIKRGADLPLLLIFAGVIGGLIGFGLVGIFIGPVALAVAYTLVGDWIAERTSPG
ncbi:MAG TPA: AI-2E family transporter YdiK [Steroidobacteraceae bacterium]|nr:AI-2E family transporter YdiK [Steroidobacteraceae bacterium]